MRARTFALFIVGVVLAGCGSADTASPDPFGELSEAASLPTCATTPKLDLKIRQTRNSANERQFRFQVFNRGSSSVRLSDLGVRMWVSNAATAALRTDVFYGGEVRNGSGAWQFNNISAQGSSASIASCSSFPNRSVNFRLEVKSSDSRSIPGNGGVWDDSQFSIHRADWQNFDNANDDYSQLPEYQNGLATDLIWPNVYGDDLYFVLYYRGTPVAEWGSATVQDHNSGHEPACVTSCNRPVNGVPQGPGHKLSGLLEELVANPNGAGKFGSNPLLTVSGNGPDAQVRVIAETTGGLGGTDGVMTQVRGVFGNIVGGNVRIRDLNALQNLPAVVSVRESLRFLPTTDDAGRLDIRADEVETNPKLGVLGESQTLNGATFGRVRVAVIDSGIDWCHPDFIDQNGNTRIREIWDQTLTGPLQFGEQPGPSAFGCSGTCPAIGVIYDQAAINSALSSCSGTRLLRTRDTNGHGTHVAGIAVGNARATGNFRGVAPEAELVVVRTDLDEVDIVSAMTHLNELDASTELASTLTAVNMSFGGHVGAHDGSDWVSRFIDIFSSQSSGYGPVLVPVISAGNDGQSDNHARSPATGTSGTGTRTLNFRIGASRDPAAVPLLPPGIPPGGSIYLDAWFDVPAGTPPASVYASATLTVPGWGSVGPVLRPALSAVDGTLTATSVTNVGLKITVNAFNRALLNGQERVLVTITNVSTTFVVLPISLSPDVTVADMTLTLNGVSASRTVDAWLSPTISSSPYVGLFMSNVVQDGTLGIPGTTNESVTVASYVTAGGPFGSLSAFSSKGPIRPHPGNSYYLGNVGVLKPDIAAPGQRIASARSRDVLPVVGDPDAQHTNKQGTSQAAPQVTGSVALMFSAFDRAQGPQFGAVPYKFVIRPELLRTARRDANTNTGVVPTTLQHTPDWGFGKLDTFHAVLSVARPGWEQVLSDPIAQVLVSASFPSDQTVFVRTIPGIVRKSTGGGQATTWVAPFVTPTGITSVSALALHPQYSETTNRVLFLAGSDGVNPARLFVSTNGGATAAGWSEVSGVPGIGSSIESITPSRAYATDGMLFVTLGGPSGGLYRASVAGVWSAELLAQVQTFLVSPLFCGAGACPTPSDQFLLAWTGSGPVQRSLNGGSTWQDLPGLPSDSVATGLVTAFAASKPNGANFTVFAVGGDSAGSPFSGGFGTFLGRNTNPKGTGVSSLWQSNEVSAGGCSGGVFPGCPRQSSVLSALAVSPDVERDAKIFTAQRPGLGTGAGTGDPTSPPPGGVYKSLVVDLSPTTPTLAWVGGGFPPAGARSGPPADLLPVTVLAISPDWVGDATLFAGAAAPDGVGDGLYLDPLKAPPLTFPAYSSRH